jgi:aryl carrier-like protein
MLPNIFIAVSSLPLTPNGKIDRNALPDPSDGQLVFSDDYAPASTDSESMLVSIWQGALGIENVGVGDNFFALGGNSLNALHVVARMREAGIQCGVKELYQHQTIAQLASSLTLKNMEALDE